MLIRVAQGRKKVLKSMGCWVLFAGLLSDSPTEWRAWLNEGVNLDLYTNVPLAI